MSKKRSVFLFGKNYNFIRNDLIMPVSTNDKIKLRKYLREIERKYREFVNPTLVRLLKFSGYGSVEEKSDGVYVYDSKGEKYLDFAGGYGVFSLGHRNRRVIEAVKDQLDKIPMSSKVFFNSLMADLAEKLAGIAPGDLKYSFFCNSGAEAVEGAVKIARRASGKARIIATKNSFHGKTLGALSLSGRDLFKKGFHPLLPDVAHVPYGDVEAIKNLVDEHCAAVIVEPIQGEGGIIVPPDDYLPAVQKICRDRGVLLIADEVQTGLGRTGKMFAVEHYGVEPDLMCLAKALGGGVMPIGAFMGTPQVWKAFEENPLIHTTTFGGNQAACRAAIETISILLEEGLVENSRKMGDYLKREIQKIADQYPRIISEVRGKGLMIGVELEQEKFGGSIIMEMSKRRVIAVYTLNKPKVLRFEPPLIVERKHIDSCVDAFGESVEETQKRFL